MVRLSQIKQKGKLNMDKKMREILGKQYKLLVDDPLNPYGTFWPSNFLKAGYDAGFEYDDFQSGVPVLKLKNLGKKQLPPIKKKGLSFKDSTINSPHKNKSGQNSSSACKILSALSPLRCCAAKFLSTWKFDSETVLLLWR